MRIHKNKMKDGDPAITTAQNPKQLDKALLFWRNSERLSLNSVLNNFDFMRMNLCFDLQLQDMILYRVSK